MNLDKAFLRRVKRHVTGPEQTFFAAVSPGLKKICFKEINSLNIPVNDILVVDGGVEFKANVYECYMANLHLRTPNRILMRIGEFKATNFRKLESKLADFPWELFLNINSKLLFNITSKKSRLYHKGAIEEKFINSINYCFKKVFNLNQNRTQNIIQKIFIRVLDDRFVISIDSSGELLYKRGLKQGWGGSAPIRETLASGLLTMADYNPLEPLIDPMCGSGTFALEGAMIAKNIPPGYFREFTFMNWPCFAEKRWMYLKQESEKKFIEIKNIRILASDKNSKTYNDLKKNVEKYGLDDTIKVVKHDFFNLSKSDIQNYLESDATSGMFIINPPYGIRIGTKNQSIKLFDSICLKLKQDFKGWKLAIISPESKDLPFKMKSYAFFHGGLSLNLLVGKIT